MVHTFLIFFVQVTGLCLRQQHPHVAQLLLGGFHHLYLGFLLTEFHTQRTHPLVHQQINNHSPQGYTYYYIYYYHHIFI